MAGRRTLIRSTVARLSSSLGTSAAFGAQNRSGRKPNRRETRHPGSGGVSPRRTVALTKVMNEHDDLISRLRAFGRRPVDPDLAARHLSAMAAPSPADAPPRGHRLRVVAAFTVGLLAGTTGLATAGALPNGVQEIAHSTLGSVGVNVPHGNRYQGSECGKVFKNHGQYVRSQPKGNRAAAAASRCGKPLGAGADDGNGGAPEKAGCQGPPPWAGKGKPDKAARDARKQACGDHDEAGGDQKTGEGQTAPAPAPEAVQGAGPAPETTSPSATPPPVTAEPSTTTTTTDTTSTTTPSEDTTSTTTVPVPVPGLGS